MTPARPRRAVSPAGGRRLPEWVRVWRCVLAPGQSLPYDDARWRGAIALIERGAIEVECRDGGRRRFARGALLPLDGLALVAIHNSGREPAVLGVIQRRADESPASQQSSPPADR